MSQTCLQQQRDAAAAAAASAGAYGPYSAMFHHATHHSTAATADLYSRSCAAATGSGSGSAAAGSHSMGGYGSPPVTSAGSLGHPQGSSGMLNSYASGKMSLRGSPCGIFCRRHSIG